MAGGGAGAGLAARDGALVAIATAISRHSDGVSALTVAVALDQQRVAARRERRGGEDGVDAAVAVVVAARNLAAPLVVNPEPGVVRRAAAVEDVDTLGGNLERVGVVGRGPAEAGGVAGGGAGAGLAARDGALVAIATAISRHSDGVSALTVAVALDQQRVAARRERRGGEDGVDAAVAVVVAARNLAAPLVVNPEPGVVRRAAAVEDVDTLGGNLERVGVVGRGPAEAGGVAGGGAGAGLAARDGALGRPRGPGHRVTAVATTVADWHLGGRDDVGCHRGDVDWSRGDADGDRGGLAWGEEHHHDDDEHGGGRDCFTWPWVGLGVLGVGWVCLGARWIMNGYTSSARQGR